MSQEDYERLMGGYTVESSIKTYPRVDTDDIGNVKKSEENMEIYHEDKALADTGDKNTAAFNPGKSTGAKKNSDRKSA